MKRGNVVVVRLGDVMLPAVVLSVDATHYWVVWLTYHIRFECLIGCVGTGGNFGLRSQTAGGSAYGLSALTPWWPLGFAALPSDAKDLLWSDDARRIAHLCGIDPGPRVHPDTWPYEHVGCDGDSPVDTCGIPVREFPLERDLAVLLRGSRLMPTPTEPTS